MRCFASFTCFLSVLVVVSCAPFLSGSSSASLQIGGGNAPSSGASGGNGLTGLTNILSQIDLPGLLRGVNSFVKLVGVFCPPLSQVLDNVIQNVTSIAFRTFGRAILQSGGLGGNGGSSEGGQRVSVVLPTFPPDDYEEDEEEETESPSDDNNVTETSTNAFPANEESNDIAKRHVRVTRDVEAEEEDDDQQFAESALEEDTAEDDQERNKRFLPGGTDGHGGGGGSGNFLFDLVRNTADRAARTVGTVYRMIAGTENNWGASAPSHQSADKEKIVAESSSSIQLVAGSGTSEDADEKANAPGVVEVDVQKSAAEHEGIPGPITRLFVIANRGVANLVQDLILRLAQTSERLVNFKARLITSLI